MVGYFYENDEHSLEWGETVEAMSKWFQEAKEYKEKYEKLKIDHDILVDQYSKLWKEYQELGEKQTPIRTYPIPTYPQPIYPNQPYTDPYPWIIQPMITYSTNKIK